MKASITSALTESFILAGAQLAFSSFIVTSLYIAKNVVNSQLSLDELNGDLRQALLVEMLWTAATVSLMAIKYGWIGAAFCIISNMIAMLYINISMRRTMKYVAKKNNLKVPRFL